MRNPIIEFFKWTITGCPLGLFVITGMIQSDAASSAADQQVAAQKEANKSNERIAQQQIDYLTQSRNQANAMQRPFANIGLGAQNKLSYLLGLGNTAYGFNDKVLNQGAAPEYTWNQWVKDNQKVISQLKAKPPKKGTPEYSKWQKDLANRTLNLNQNNPFAQSAFEDWKAVKSKASPSTQPGYTTTKVPITPSYGSLLKDFTMKDFVADPGYQFRMEQGNRDLQERLAAMGLTSSGRALKEGMRFNQGLADQTYNDAYNRYQTNRNTKFNFLSGLGGSGQNAANVISGTNTNFGGQVSGALGNLGQNLNANLIGMGDSRAAGTIGQGNAWSGALGNLTKFGAMALGGF